MKMEKITTAMVEVLRAPVMSRKGLAGMNSSIILAKDMLSTLPRVVCSAAPRALSAAPEVSPSAVRPNRLDIRMPAPAAMAVVKISTPMVMALILPSAVPPLSFKIALMMETMMSGMMIICSSFT